MSEPEDRLTENPYSTPGPEDRDRDRMAEEMAKHFEGIIESPKVLSELVERLLDDPKFPVGHTDRRRLDVSTAESMVFLLPTMYRSNGDSFAMLAALARQLISLTDLKVENLQRISRRRVDELEDRTKSRDENSLAQDQMIQKINARLAALETDVETAAHVPKAERQPFHPSTRCECGHPFSKHIQIGNHGCLFEDPDVPAFADRDCSCMVFARASVGLAKPFEFSSPSIQRVIETAHDLEGK